MGTKMAKKTFYDVLQVSPSADPEIIKAAYKSLVQRYHPDKNAGNPEAEKYLKIINRAYEVLSDPVKRAGYDAALAEADEDDGKASFAEKAATGSAPADASAQTSGSNNVDLYKAAIGEKNTTYYLTKFEQFDQQGPGLKASWNWPAFFLVGFWALYRKMYGWFFAIWGISILAGIAEKIDQTGLSAVFFLGLWIAFSIYANALYHGKVRKKIEAARLTLRDESRLLSYLRQAGGVHTWVIWAFGLVPIIGIVAAIAIPTYQDYQKRAVAQQSQKPATSGFDPDAYLAGGASPQSPQPAPQDQPHGFIPDQDQPHGFIPDQDQPHGFIPDDGASPQSPQPATQNDKDPLGILGGASPQNQQPTTPNSASNRRKH
jgi:hypothetical protein